MNKRSSILSLLLAFAIVFSSITPIFSRESMTDMPKGWSKEYVESAVNNGILIGDKGKVRPKDNMTRAEFVTVISRILGLSEKADVSQYTDVKPEAWYYDDIARAVKAGLVDGRSSTKMEPNGPIKREEAFTIIARMLLLSEDKDYTNVFVDGNKVSDWAKSSISALVKGNYIEGNDYKQVKPRHNITREEMAALLYRLIDLYVGEDLVGKEIVGNVVANDNLENIKDTTIHGDLILGEGVDVEEVKLNNVKVHGRLIVRSGADLRIVNGSEVNHAKAIDRTITKIDNESQLGDRNENIIIEDGVDETPGGEDKPTPGEPEETPGGEDKPTPGKPEETPEAPLPDLPSKPENEEKEYNFKEKLRIEVQKEGEFKRLKFSEDMDKPVIVEIYKDGKKVGEGGKTEESTGFGTAVLNLTKPGEYELVVKDGEEELARILLNVIDKEKLKKEIEDIQDRLNKLNPKLDSQKPSGLDSKKEEIKSKLKDVENLINDKDISQNELEDKVKSIKESVSTLEENYAEASIFKVINGMLFNESLEEILQNISAEQFNEYLNSALKEYEGLDKGQKELLTEEKEILDKLNKVSVLDLPESSKSMGTENIMFLSKRLIEEKEDGSLGAQLAVNQDTLISAYTGELGNNLTGKNFKNEDKSIYIPDVSEVEEITVGDFNIDLVIISEKLVLKEANMSKELFQGIKNTSDSNEEKSYYITVTDGLKTNPKTKIAKIEFKLVGEKVEAELIN